MAAAEPQPGAPRLRLELGGLAAAPVAAGLPRHAAPAPPAGKSRRPVGGFFCRSRAPQRVEEAGGVLVVNVNPRGRRKWLVKVYDPRRPTLDDMPDVYPSEYARLLLLALAEKLRSLPARLRLPRCERVYLPSFLLVAYRARAADGGSAPSWVEVLDVAAVKPDKAPSPWSYRYSYWHPSLQRRAAEALEAAAERLAAQQRG